MTNTIQYSVVRDIQLLPEVELEWVSKHIGALSVWCYKLVYGYFLSMKVDSLSFGELLQRFYSLGTNGGDSDQFLVFMCYVSLCLFVRCVVYKVFPHF